MIMYYYVMSLLLGIATLSHAKQCNNTIKTTNCKTFGTRCECSDLDCFPNRNPCDPSTTDMVFLGSLFDTIQKDTFADYGDITFLGISGSVGGIERESFKGLSNLLMLRINAFSISASKRSWSTDVDKYIAHLTGLIGLRAIEGGALSNPSMTSLDLSFNQIKNMNEDIFNGLDNMKEIGLAGNAIEKLDERIFKRVPLLEKLYLTNNVISHMVFMTNTSDGALKHLKFLDLFGNELTTFPSLILETASTNFNIDIRENPLICDCNMVDLLQRLGSEQQIIGLDPACHNPVEKCSPPKIASTSQEFQVPQGESFLLQLEIQGSPHPFVSIMGPDGELRVGTYNINTNEVLVVIYIEHESDFGVYTCTAKNSHGSTTFNISVKAVIHDRNTTTAENKKPHSTNGTVKHTLSILLIIAISLLRYISV
ncbi:uncharacterized protein [Antedon mediterranea]|uniref:uncharacterized protein n=1 Tax=Antedon mediterranea TaxID=105859 RepID=UPI003AF58BD5